MANDYASQGLTGKYPRKTINVTASHLWVPAVESQDFDVDSLKDKGHVINDPTKSGKQAGASVIVDNVITIASGKDPLAVWYQTKNTTTITPA